MPRVCSEAELKRWRGLSERCLFELLPHDRSQGTNAGMYVSACQGACAVNVCVWCICVVYVWYVYTYVYVWARCWCVHCVAYVSIYVRVCTCAMCVSNMMCVAYVCVCMCCIHGCACDVYVHVQICVCSVCVCVVCMFDACMCMFVRFIYSCFWGM